MLGGQLHITPSFENLARNAKFIREEIKNMKSPFENWASTANQLQHEICAYPEVLELFPINLLSAEKTPSKRVKRVVYNTSRGQIKTIKHVQTGSNMTQNKLKEGH